MTYNSFHLYTVIMVKHLANSTKMESSQRFCIHLGELVNFGFYPTEALGFTFRNEADFSTI